MAKAGTSLWLSPPAGSAALTTLTSLISSLGSTYKTPAFTPHVTLLNGMPPNLTDSELIDGVKRGIDLFRQACEEDDDLPAEVELEFNKLGTNGIYFQFVFAALLDGKGQGPAAEMLRLLRANLRKAFKMDEEEPASFFPHMSLVYADETPGVTEAKKIIAQLEEDGTAQVTEDGGLELKGISGFWAKEITAMRAEGPVDTWIEVAKIPLP